jgi:predicted DNA-binding transcriptional regulator AlpA
MNGVIEKLVGVDELAKHFGLPKTWFYSRTYRKDSERVPHLKCGKYVKFRLSEVSAWLDKKQNAQSA